MRTREASVDIVLVWERETLTGLFFQNKYVFSEGRLDVTGGWLRKGGGENGVLSFSLIYFSST